LIPTRSPSLGDLEDESLRLSWLRCVPRSDDEGWLPSVGTRVEQLPIGVHALFGGIGRSFVVPAGQNTLDGEVHLDGDFELRLVETFVESEIDVVLTEGLGWGGVATRLPVEKLEIQGADAHASFVDA
jgi:hypothetical protein